MPALRLYRSENARTLPQLRKVVFLITELDKRVLHLMQTKAASGLIRVRRKDISEGLNIHNCSGSTSMSLNRLKAYGCIRQHFDKTYSMTEKGHKVLRLEVALENTLEGRI